MYVPIGEGKTLVERLRDGEGGRELYRDLGQYGVSVYAQHLEALDRAGAIARLEDGSFVLTDVRLYSEKTGLALEAKSGEAQLFDCILKFGYIYVKIYVECCRTIFDANFGKE